MLSIPNTYALSLLRVIVNLNVYIALRKLQAIFAQTRHVMSFTFFFTLWVFRKRINIVLYIPFNVEPLCDRGASVISRALIGYSTATQGHVPATDDGQTATTPRTLTTTEPTKISLTTHPKIPLNYKSRLYEVRCTLDRYLKI